ncbi:lysyl-tRNA synthetase [gamma proteobacterium HTCC5015]|nr:lysyl-tRNA synthetase [gamma proteobacterium HTCC5015]
MFTSDSWQPSASIEALRHRARILQGIRAFFDERGVLEVNTPSLSRAATTDVHLDSYRVETDSGPRYLHTSPELPMKRLLAAGVGDCYQLCAVFRPSEQGRYHNPEFTLLEWYRTAYSIDDLIVETAALIRALLPLAPADNSALPADLPLVSVRYSDAFKARLGLCPLAATEHELQTLLHDNGLWSKEQGILPKDSALDLLFSQAVSRHFPERQLTAVTHYPASQAALAQLTPDDPATAQRSELYWGQVELANGFKELTDADEQRARFEADNRERKAKGLIEQPMDECFLQALKQGGMPDCSGIALGVDRLMMKLLDADQIQAVMAFDASRA